jgi:NitT/TauT family transport system permease protein
LAWIFAAHQLPPQILPGPGLVWTRFMTALSDGTYVPSLYVTAAETATGWLIAVAVAVPAGYLIGRIRVLEDALAPYLASSQAMPIVAIAPLLAVWVGYGMPSIVTICALIAFFPVLATTAGGIRGVPRDLVDAGHVFGAGRLQMARYVYFPLASRAIFSGLKVAAALSVTGAVVGEYVSSDRGLGTLVMQGSNNFDTPLAFVALISLMALGGLAYFMVSLVERLLLQWDG